MYCIELKIFLTYFALSNFNNQQLFTTVSEAPGGVFFRKYIEMPDGVLDYWHPLEKAAYPKYFAKRELRKRQYLEMWEKQYGPPPKEEYH